MKWHTYKEKSNREINKEMKRRINILEVITAIAYAQTPWCSERTNTALSYRSFDKQSRLEKSLGDQSGPLPCDGRTGA